MTTEIRNIFRSGSLSLAIRAITLSSRFLLLLSLARHISTADLGIYGLISSTISVCILFIGLDFYTLNNREIAARNPEEWPTLLRDQAVFHLISYVFILPMLSVLFWAGPLPWTSLGWFYLILVAEHLSQEIYRLLIAVQRPVKANFVLFVRSGFWSYVVLIVMATVEDLRSIKIVWSGWLAGSMLSIILGIFFLVDLPWENIREQRIDWARIRRYALQSVPLLGATVALRGIETVDRYFIQNHSGSDMVGIYTFYYSMASVVQTFAFTGIFSTAYPKLIAADQRNDDATRQKIIKSMRSGGIIGGGIMSILMAVAIIPISALVDNPVYHQHLGTYWTLVIAIFVGAISLIPHYDLYSRRQDRPLILSSMLGLVVAVVLNWWLVPWLGIQGAALSTLGATATVGSIKLIYARQVRTRNSIERLIMP